MPSTSRLMKTRFVPTCIGALVVLAIGTPAPAADLYWSGSGTWDTSTANWGTASGGPYDAATWSSGDHAIFEGPAGTVTLAGDIDLTALTFTAGNYTITGGTLNFAPGGVIDMAAEDRNQTITSGITGSPAVRIQSGAHNPYNQITFAPDLGTQTLGDILSPYDSGSGDKGRVTLGGTTTGNSVASISYEPRPPAGRNLHYGLVEKVGSGTWTVGDLDAGVIHIQSETLIVNGTMSSLYQGLVNYGVPAGARLSGDCTYYCNDGRFGPFTVKSGGIVAPGDHGIGTITTSWGTQRADARTTTFDDGSIYEWEVGSAGTDTVHIKRVSRPRALALGNMTLKILDAGGKPSATDQLPVFTYDDGVTRTLGTVSFDTSALGETWDTSALSLVDDNAGTIYLTGLSNVITPIVLTIVPNGANFDFSWDSKDGKLYDLVSSTDLMTAPETWPAWNGNADIVGAAPTNMLTSVPGGGPIRFFAVIEKDPPPLFSEDFEADNGGFISENKGTGTDWSWGAAASADLGGGGVTSGNGGSSQCWGTNLTGGYAAGTDACLRSGIIDLTGVTAAELSFALAMDADAGHTYLVNVIAAGTDTVVANLIPATEDADNMASPWQTVGPTVIPAPALGQMIRLEWRFTGAGTGDYNGVYIDDVLVTRP